MIMATMQGASVADNYAHVTARDGELLTGAAKQACIDEIFDAADGVRVDEIGEGVRRLGAGSGGSRGAGGSGGGARLLCTLYHPVRDDGGRRRLVVFVIDEDAAGKTSAGRGVVERTFAAMGVGVARFDNHYKDFCSREQMKKIGIIVAGAAGALAIAAIAIGASCLKSPS